MEKMVRSINPHISVDCVIFGFSTSQLKVLLIHRDYLNEKGKPEQDHKLPGDFITTREDLDLAAARTLKELTGTVYSADEDAAQTPALIHSTVAPGQTVTEAIVVIDLCDSTGNHP